MTAPHPDLVISVTRQILFPAATIFNAWRDPQTIGNWLFATPAGQMLRVELDPREGGKFLIAEQRGASLAEHRGTFITLEKSRRIVFDFTTAPSTTSTRVTVDLVATPDGTNVTISHPLAPEWASYADRARLGWSLILNNLETTLRSTPAKKSTR